MTFSVSEDAREDLARAIRFYNSKPGRYGRAVAREFARAAKAIAANPRQYSPVDDDIPGIEFREFFIDRFDQRVIYLVRVAFWSSQSYTFLDVRAHGTTGCLRSKGVIEAQ